MKTKIQLATCVALVALTGCDSNNSTTGEKPPESPARKGAVIELSNAPAVATLNRETTPVPPPAVAPADKMDFITSSEQKLKDFDTKIDELVKKSADYKDDAKAQADLALAALRDQRSKLNAQFESLKTASADHWKEIKAGFESALHELERTYEDAKSKFG